MKRKYVQKKAKGKLLWIKVTVRDYDTCMKQNKTAERQVMSGPREVRLNSLF